MANSIAMGEGVVTEAARVVAEAERRAREEYAVSVAASLLRVTRWTTAEVVMFKGKVKP